MWIWWAVFSYSAHKSKSIQEKKDNSNHKTGLQQYTYPWPTLWNSPPCVCVCVCVCVSCCIPPWGSKVLTDNLVMPSCLLNLSGFHTLNEHTSPIEMSASEMLSHSLSRGLSKLRHNPEKQKTLQRTPKLLSNSRYHQLCRLTLFLANICMFNRIWGYFSNKCSLVTR